MGLVDISLTSAMRTTLFSLQNTSAKVERTQERLASGKKVMSALDNPTNYFAAQAHLNRAADLTGRKDGIMEAIKNGDAANVGLKSLVSLLETAKGVASGALMTNSKKERLDFAKTFNELLDQNDGIVRDSSYRGTNLINGDSLTVEFSEVTGNSSLTIDGVNTDYASLGIDKAPELQPFFQSTNYPDGNVDLDSFKAQVTLDFGDDMEKIVPSSVILINDTQSKTLETPVAQYLDPANNAITFYFDYLPTPTDEYYNNWDVNRQENKFEVSGTGGVAVDKVFVSGVEIDPQHYQYYVYGSDPTSGRITFDDGHEPGGNDSITYTLVGSSTQYATSPTTGQPVRWYSNHAELTTTDLTIPNWTDEQIKAAQKQIEEGISRLRTDSTKLGAQLSVIGIRKEFTDSMVANLQTGADNLTLADMNEEGANMLMLQTRQNLGITA